MAVGQQPSRTGLCCLPSGKSQGGPSGAAGPGERGLGSRTLAAAGTVPQVPLRSGVCLVQTAGGFGTSLSLC